MTSRFFFPVVFALVVAVLPSTLVTVGARSPYTHANLTSGYDASYARTDQIEVGAPVFYKGTGLAVPIPATAPLAVRGKAILVARGCAGCHGIDGKGGPVGPAMMADIEVLRDNVRKGPGGMPVFSTQDLTDYDLTAIVAYLNSVKK